MDSLEDEKQSLMANLQKVQEKFLDNWSQSFILRTSEKEDKFKTSMAAGKGSALIQNTKFGSVAKDHAEFKLFSSS